MMARITGMTGRFGRGEQARDRHRLVQAGAALEGQIVDEPSQVLA
jgi:hypothetical protein